MEALKEYKLEIENYDINGLGVGKKDGIIIFVKGALKGETVMALITSIHKKYAFAEMTKILSDISVDRIIPTCPYFEGCGGCDLLHMQYDCECQVKENKVINTLKPVARIQSFKVNNLKANKNILGYRNKILVPFGYDEDDNVIYGFYEKLSHKIVSIDRCEISNQYANQVLEFIRKYVSVMHIKVYNEVDNSGVFRGVMLRNNYKNEIMVVFIVTKYIDLTGLISYLETDYPLVKSAYLNINASKTNVMLGEEYIHLYGDKFLTENILGLKFEVSAASFMQVNHRGCEILYEEAFRMVKLTKDMEIIDAYCGMGSITLNIAKKVKHVYGIEIVKEAIDNANRNKELNGITNVTFICGKCEEEIKKLVNLKQIDCIFFDPPRKGCEEEFLKTVCEMKIPKIIYISCNIATATRDILYLLENNYQLEEVTPVDLFSKTSHVECVCQLSLKDETKYITKV